MDRAGQQSGADLNRQHLPSSLYTGIWWYAKFPNHYAGDGSAATKALGDYRMNAQINNLVQAIRAVKADSVSLQLQNEFYQKSTHPLDTPQ
jgi:creatinine amidohydrolase